MANIKIIYWTGTGNTAMMAGHIAEGVKAAGVEASLYNVSEVAVSDLVDDKVFALGCPSMGAEQLEEGEMEPFMEELESVISGKQIALFGSYGWGNGEWMDDWVMRCQAAGATVVNGEGVICKDAPDEEAIASLTALGSALAGFAKLD